MSELRRAIMDAMDVCHEQTGGDTPDHIILSESDYANVRAEVVRNPIPVTSEGYMGMTMWHSAALDERDKRVLLLSDEVFDHFFGWHGDEPPSKDL